jgi:hypothetical protein
MKQIGFSSFEVLYGHPPCLIKGIQGDRKEIGDLTLTQQIQALGSTLLKINDWVRKRLPISLTTATHPYRPGNAVWVKEWNVQPLKPHWRDPFLVILSTPTIVKEQRSLPGSTTAQWSHLLLNGSASLIRITLQNTCTLLGPYLPGNNRGPRMTGQPCSSHSRSWLISQWNVEESSPSLFKDDSLLYFPFLNLISFLLGIPKLQTVIYVYILPEQEVLSPRSYFFILTIPVQALSSGHASTTIPSIQCAPMVINIPASIPSTSPRRNG